MYATLCAFNMNQRAARLVPLETFRNNVKCLEADLVTLSDKRLELLSDAGFESVLERVQQLFERLTVMQGTSQLVGVSKTLHFLLPNLIMPVDRTYTLAFFYGANVNFNDRETEWRLFEPILKFTHLMGRRIMSCNVPRGQQ